MKFAQLKNPLRITIFLGGIGLIAFAILILHFFFLSCCFFFLCAIPFVIGNANKLVVVVGLGTETGCNKYHLGSTRIITFSDFLRTVLPKTVLKPL